MDTYDAAYCGEDPDDDWPALMHHSVARSVEQDTLDPLTPAPEDDRIRQQVESDSAELSIQLAVATVKLRQLREKARWYAMLARSIPDGGLHIADSPCPPYIWLYPARDVGGKRTYGVRVDGQDVACHRSIDDACAVITALIEDGHVITP